MDHRDYGSIMGYIGGNGGVFGKGRFERRVLTRVIWIGWQIHGARSGVETFTTSYFLPDLFPSFVLMCYINFWILFVNRTIFCKISIFVTRITFERELFIV